MIKQIFFKNYIDMGIKKRRIRCQVRIRWKSSKKVYTKKVIGLRTFVRSIERWKSTTFLHFHANNFFVGFFTTFSKDSKSASNSAFFGTQIEIIWKNYLLGHISLFCTLWSRARTKRPKKRKNLFSNVNQNKLYLLILVSTQQVSP